jgi:uncharacterized membrane protein
MTLTETGQARVRGYMFVLERSLRTFLPPPVVADAVREVETHIFERLEQMPGGAEERATVERVLAELGAPLRVAQAYSMEMTVDEAIITGRLGAIARGLWNIAASTVVGFFTSLGLFVGYGIGASFIVIAALKPIFPNNVGLFFVNGAVRSFGAEIGLAPGTVVRGGYWIIPVSLVIGAAMLLVTHALARRVLASWKRRLAERREIRLLTPRPSSPDAVTARSR